MVIVGALAMLGGCRARQESGQPPPRPFDSRRMEALVPTLLKEEKAAGVGIAVLRDGRVLWTGYYGEQSPGIALSASTAFNTASVAKTITAETLLALAAKGEIDLDEPIARTSATPICRTIRAISA